MILTPSITDSVKQASKTVASDMVGMYNDQIQKTGIIGKLDDTWWVAGAMFMILMQYWHFTGDSQFNRVTSDGMYAQKGEQNNYYPANWSTWLGNDDQVFWGLAAITAAELNYPQDKGEPSWVALAQGVFNNQVPRWDTTVCNGGMRWQTHFFQDGYNLKNTVSNAGLFQLSARLAFYTNNQTYTDWANRIWEWSNSVSLIDQQQGWRVADSVENQDQCKQPADAQWTYNYGLYIGGAAYMFNHVSINFFFLLFLAANMTEDEWRPTMEKPLGRTAQQDLLGILPQTIRLQRHDRTGMRTETPMRRQLGRLQGHAQQLAHFRRHHRPRGRYQDPTQTQRFRDGGCQAVLRRE